ncbi:hypothetical protein D6D28_06898 [Aureobasidium pullulans]|uniref:Uncharacterized protein n=1 Tax=Aureobasidium pullulans TaxID=5580 RepID=A0A4S8SCN0_AURPU|nr:hypothetical protein D6D28_06898 [Aureobasidium pullulans]
MDQDQAQYWLWLLEASESPPLPQHYCNDMIMSSSRFHMEHTANDASLVENHPGSPEYHSDIGNLASLHLNDSNSSPRPSQGPLQRRASYSAFQHL